MPSSRRPGNEPLGHVDASLRSWRVTTAIRVFALALAIGQSLSSGVLDQSASILFALFVIGLVASLLELGVITRWTPWIPVAEGVLAATLLTAAPPVEALLVYLSVPALVAGVRQGWVTTVNTSLVTTFGVVAASSSYRDLGFDVNRLSSSAPWLAIGLGAGFLAARQSRSVRRLEASQAPYAAAHQLMAQLHSLAQRGRVGLNSASVAAELAASLRDITGATRAAVFVHEEGCGLSLLADFGSTDGMLEAAALQSSGPVVAGELAILPLRVGDHQLGSVVLGRDTAWPETGWSESRSTLDALAIRLDTALLFDQVSSVATKEERNRLAREMHDGVAQELVALGYLVDEISEGSTDPATREATAGLREEIMRVVTELRFSIFDLRHEVSDQHLSGAIAEYVREISARSNLRVHLTFDEQGPSLPPRVEGELLRIAQEAISNVRKHARAINLWITLVTDGSAVRLEVEDDGVGLALPRERHYGLHTMRERADRLGAELTVRERPDGGTIVMVQSHLLHSSQEVFPHEHHRAAGR